MLRADPHALLRRSTTAVRRWWASGPTRLRLRRRLILLSLPAALAILALAGMLATVLLTGNNVVADYSRHDTAALRGDLDTLSRFNILEPHKLPFAQGDLAVLEGRLDDAENSFRTALSKRDACPTRINLELVVETQGDLAAARGDIDKAEQRYTAALDTVRGAPENCFAGNDDADEDRRHIRQDAEPRLVAKIESLHQRRNAPPPPPSSAAPAPAPAPADSSAPLAPTTIPAPPPDASGPPPTTAPAPAPAQSPATGPDSRPVFGPSGGPEDTAGGGSEALNDIDPDRLPTGGGAKKPGHKLGVGNGDPLDELQQALRDSNATGGNRE
jgi:hypothetical protein